MKLNKADLTVRLLATLAGCAGLWALWFAGVMLLGIIRNWDGLMGLIFLAFVVGIPLAFGVYAVIVAIRVWRPLTVRMIRRVTGLCGWVVFAVLLITILGFFDYPPAAPEDVVMPLSLLAGAIAGGVFHEWAGRRLVMRSSVAPDTPPMVSKNTVGLICFVLWIATSSVVRVLRPIQPGVIEPPYFLLTHFLGPIVFAVLTYKIIIHYAYGLPGLPFVGPMWHRMRKTRLGEVRRDRVEKHQCPACGYDVRQTLADGKSGCPECGFDLADVEFPKLPAEIA